MDAYQNEAALEAKKETMEPETEGIKKDLELEAIGTANEAAMDAELQQLEERLSTRKKPRREVTFANPAVFTYVLVGFASIGGLLSGLDQSLISGANLYMPKDLNLSSNMASLVNSGMPLGAVAGALILSPVNEYLGRRQGIIWACILYTLGAALEAGAIDFGMMFAGRFILGIGVGLEGGTVPIYVSESVPKKIRGNLVSLYQFNIALGEVFGFVVAAIFVNVPGNWRYILGSSLLFSTILLVAMFFLPESPRYLMHKGEELEAYVVWKRIRGFDSLEAKLEFLGMKRSVVMENEEHQTKRYPWMDFVTNPRARRAIVYANIMVFLGQFTGVNAVMYYMSVLMSAIGFNDKESVFMSLVGGGALMLGTIPAVLYMERFGRRYWANTMLPGFFIGLVFVGVGYQIPLDRYPKAAEGLYLTGLILYMGFFGSYACLTWVIPSEVFPTYLRSYGMTTSDANLFLCSFIVTYNFTQMMDSMTRIGLTLGFYGGIAVLGWFYQILFMPETKNKSLEEIDEIFSTPTSVIVRENIKNTVQVMRDLASFRWKKVFYPVA